MTETAPPGSESAQQQPDDFIVFFDGYCGLCNLSVDWLMSRDAQRKIRFAPLQGEVAARLLDQKDREDLDSVIVWDRGGVFRRSEAVFRAVALLGPGWNLLTALLGFVPVWVRDVAYRAVAVNRYQVFGKRDTCRLPTPDERKRFLP